MEVTFRGWLQVGRLKGEWCGQAWLEVVAADSQIVESGGLLVRCLKGIVIHFMAYLFWVECDTFTLRDMRFGILEGVFCELRQCGHWLFCDQKYMTKG